MKKKILIIGGDSRLGKVLKFELKKEKIKFVATSRKKNSKNYLDLNDINDFKINQNFSACVILAGITNYNDCEKKKNKSRLINCKNIIQISKKILNKNIFLCYVSTNTVFKSKSKSNEKSTPRPNFEYARQKYFVEKKLSNYVKNKNKSDLFSILRLTKNVSKHTEPFKSWILDIQKGNKIKAFDDLYFSPILFENSANMIKKILNKKVAGTFHVSNRYNLNYYQFALKLFSYLNLDKKKLIKINSKKQKINLIFKNKQAALSMMYTKSVLKTNYVNLIQILSYIKKQINEKN